MLLKTNRPLQRLNERLPFLRCLFCRSRNTKTIYHCEHSVVSLLFIQCVTLRHIQLSRAAAVFCGRVSGQRTRLTSLTRVNFVQMNTCDRCIILKNFTEGFAFGTRCFRIAIVCGIPNVLSPQRMQTARIHVTFGLWSSERFHSAFTNFIYFLYPSSCAG